MDSSIFDTYDYIALIVPGTVVLLWVAVLLRKTASLGGLKEVSVGGLGVLLVLAFVAGHLAALVGGPVDTVVRHTYGYATDRIIQGKVQPFDKPAMDRVNEKMKTVLKRQDRLPSAGMSNEESFALGRQMYAAVAAADRAKRVDLFNQRFGFARGLMGAFLLCAVLTPFRFGTGEVFSRRIRRAVTLGLLLAAVGMFLRMMSYGWSYALELFVQFMLLP